MATAAASFFDRFAASLGDDPVPALRAGLIGRGQAFDGGFGERRMIYADYTASGRALMQVETAILADVLPFYANSHTEASFCGATMTRLRAAARARIAEICGAGPDCHVIFAGSGCTAVLNRIVGLLGIAETVARGGRVRVLIGPYEHHSNILPWREAGAEVVEIAEGDGGGPCMADLDRALRGSAGAAMIVGSFSAASNVTGILTDTEAVTRRLKAAGALAIWDYACAAPYLPMRMDGEAPKDAIVFSPHKFPGGPGASGVGILRDSIVRRDIPTLPGGGTVSFVSPWAHRYSARVEAREEGGTPNVPGDLRAALALVVREAVGTGAILAHEERLRQQALAAWTGVPGLRVLGQGAATPALPVFSFQVFAPDGRQIHQQLVTRMLSDHWGIQARGGCACAGPYAHRLLGIDRAASEALFARIAAGEELLKPGWTRLNLSYLHDEDEVECIIRAVAELPRRALELEPLYRADPATARFTPLPVSDAA